MTSTATAWLVVTGTEPRGFEDTYTLFANTAYSVGAELTGVLANDTGDGNLSARIESTPAHGSVILNSDGSFTYTPHPGHTGSDSFTYRVAQGGSVSDPVTVHLDILQQELYTFPDAYVTLQGSTLTSASDNSVLANDAGSAAITYLDSSPSHGNLRFNADGTFSYTPDTGFVGRDSFTYTAGDGVSRSQPTLVEIIVINSAPVSHVDAYAVHAGQTLTVSSGSTTVPTLLANDIDFDGQSVSARLVSTTTYGSLNLSGDGTFTYTPHPSFVGIDTFSYLVSDGTATSAPVTVTLAVTDSVAFATSDAYLAHRGKTLSVAHDATDRLLVNDADPDGDTTYVRLVNAPSHGRLIVNSDGSLHYTPEESFDGVDGFVYQIVTPTGVGNSVDVTFHVPNVSPVAFSTLFSVEAGGLLEGNILRPKVSTSHTYNSAVQEVGGIFGVDFAVLGGAVQLDQAQAAVTAKIASAATSSDPDGDAIRVELVTMPTHGSLTLDSKGEFTYFPNEGFAGVDSFEYRITDGVSYSQPASASLFVFNAPPVSAPD